MTPEAQAADLAEAERLVPGAHGAICRGWSGKVCDCGRGERVAAIAAALAKAREDEREVCVKIAERWSPEHWITKAIRVRGSDAAR